MEFVFLGLLVLAFPVIAIVALVKTININERLRGIEARLAALEPRMTARCRRDAAAAAAPPPAPNSSRFCRRRRRVEQPAPPPRPEPKPEPVVTPPAQPAEAAEPERVVSFEEKFGTRWTVWIGGVALALGGIFLVKYSIEAGLIGPGLRLFFGALLAARSCRRRRMGAPAEAARGLRRLSQRATSRASSPPPAPPSPTPRSMRPMALYGFLDPAFAFVLLGAVALATLAAALLHGPALAALGLVGAYVTPMLVASNEPNYWALYIYLAVVTAAAFALALVRLWQWLAHHRGRASASSGCCRASTTTASMRSARICSMWSRLRARRRADRRRSVLRPIGGAGEDRPALGHRARGLRLRRAAAGAGEPPRSGGAHRCSRC